MWLILKNLYNNIVPHHQHDWYDMISEQKYAVRHIIQSDPFSITQLLLLYLTDILLYDRLFKEMRWITLELEWREIKYWMKCVLLYTLATGIANHDTIALRLWFHMTHYLFLCNMTKQNKQLKTITWIKLLMKRDDGNVFDIAMA